VRVLTAHGSKGLEFDAVHFLEATQKIFEPSREDGNPWLPEGITTPASSTFGGLRTERHNLLYVVISRARQFLTVYTQDPTRLPGALEGLLESLSVEVTPRARQRTPAHATRERIVTVALEDYLRFIRCPHEHVLASRSIRVPRGELKLHNLVDLSVRAALQIFSSEPQTRSQGSWREVADTALKQFGIDQHASAGGIRQHACALIDQGRRWLLEGGEARPTVPMQLGGLVVNFEADQAFETAREWRLRLIRTQASSVSALKQPLAALLDAHHRGGGRRVTVEVATLSDAQLTRVGSIQTQTRERYIERAAQLCAARYPRTPLDPRNCLTCRYLFPCVGIERP
jgi:DNA helicase-2/ATP-dependent DNA helicase PcrA